MSVFAEGTSGDDILLGSIDADILRDELGGNDEIYGGDGDDYVAAFRGFDIIGSALLDAGAGDDFITFGSDFNDVDVIIRAGDGNDDINASGGALMTIDAGAGDDVMILDHEGTDYTITLGAGIDLITFNGVSWVFSPGPAMVITDFAPGLQGDRLILHNFLEKLVGWEFYSNPFATGHFAMEQRGADAVLRIDQFGNGAVVTDFVIFQGVDMTSLTPWNIGFAADGSPTQGLTLTGSDDHEHIIGTGGGDTIDGGLGSDFIEAGAGNDVVNGGDEGDTLDGLWGDDVLNGGSGDDHLVDQMGGNDQLFGGAGKDSFHVMRFGEQAPATMVLDGGEEADTFFFFADAGRPGDIISLIGGGGDDQVTYAGGITASIDVGEGNDRLGLTLAETDYSVTLGAGADVVSLANYSQAGAWPGRIFFADFQAGNSGDRLELRPSLLTSKVHGWAVGSNPFSTGNLRLGQRGADTVLQADRDGGGDGFETIVRFANTVATSLTAFNLGGVTPMGLIATVGSEGNDSLGGGAQADSLDGAGGNDLIDGGAGADRMIGGAGNDTFLVDNVGDKVFETSASGGIDLVMSSIAFTLGTNFERLTLTGGAHISGTGNDAANVIAGNAGNNRLDGGAGADVLKGAGGNDTYVVDDAGDQIQEAAGQGTDLVLASVSHSLAFAVENLTLTGTANIDGNGNSASNLILGNSGNNFLNGMGAADVMKGGAGNDTYYVDNAGDVASEAFNQGTDAIFASVSYVLGGEVEGLTLTGLGSNSGTGNYGFNQLTGNAGANVLSGLGGADSIDGGAGNDSLYGGTGRDSLTGGAGRDGFYFDSPVGAGNADDILDFSVADDTIYLDDAMFTGIAPGPLAASAFVVGTAAADAGDRIIHNQATGQIYYDSDGAGGAGAVLFATVAPATVLTSADFIGY